MKRKTKLLLAKILVVILTFCNVFSVLPTVSVNAQTRTKVTAVRTNELVSGGKYILIGGEQDGSQYYAVTAGTHDSSGISVLDKATVSGLDLTDAEDEISVSEDYLWTITQNGEGASALYNESAGKYMSFAQESRSVTLADSAVYYETVQVTSTQKLPNDGMVSGKAYAFRTGTWYLNYSTSKNGFCACNAATYNQDETQPTNQYVLYQMKEEAATPTVKNAVRATEITFGDEYVLVGGNANDNTYRGVVAATHSGSKVTSVLDEKEFSNLDFNDAANTLEAEDSYVWQIVEGESGTAALYNKAAKKYVHFEQGARTTTLEDTPTYFEMVVTDHHVAGKAVAFRTGTWYLNYSYSQGGFNAYDGSSNNQNETQSSNHCAFYKVASSGQSGDTGRTDEPNATLLFCSDFQTGTEVSPYTSADDVPSSLTSILGNISEEIYEDGITTIDSVLAVGDYSAFTGRYNYDADPTYGIEAFKGIVQAQWEDTDDFLFIQGNHDSSDYPYDEGAHEYEDYIVYCINTMYNNGEMGSFPWMQGSTGAESKVKKAAEVLDAYLEDCVATGEDRPIIIMVHVPLHFSGRTSSLYGNGDNLYSSYLFDVINEAAEDLNIVYLFGHNHSNGWDNYLGGTRVFKQPGDTILIPDLSKKSGSVTNSYVKEELNFTYMNAGYIGYVHDSITADELTATVCQIYDDEIVLKRYSEDGLIDIGAVGKNNTKYNDSSMIPTTELGTKTASPVSIELMKDAVAEVSLVSEVTNSVGETSVLTATAKHLKDATYTWTISDPAVAQITADGKEASIYCKKAGEAVITVTAKYGENSEVSATSKLTVTHDADADPTVKIVDAKGKDITSATKGDTITVHGAVAGIPEVVSYKWTVSGVGKVEKQENANAEITFDKTGQSKITVEVTYKDAQGAEKTVKTTLTVEVVQVPTFKRVSQVESGKSYMLIGSSGKALDANTLTVDGVACIKGKTISEANLNNTSDEFKGEYEDCVWTITSLEGPGGMYTLYNVSTGKYLTMEASRDISLNSVEAYLQIKTSTFQSGSGASVSFVYGDMYLNHSKTKQAYCGYGDGYENEASVNNQFALYELVAEKEEETGKENPFVDVKDGAYYYNAVLWAVENGITTGTTDTTFSPDNYCTRAQVVMFLWRAAGEPEPAATENPFTDVSSGSRFYKAIMWAYENGITTGYKDHTFRPYDQVRRGEYITFQWRAAGKPSVTLTSNPFKDVTKEAFPHFYDAIMWAAENQITLGKNGNFMPNGNSTRGDVVTFLYRGEGL